MRAKQNKKNITAGEILDAIRSKYTKSQFIPEIAIQVGDNTLHRLDAWLLKPGYSPLTAVGWEIKTRRADWLNDSKWPAYLAVCQEFYFVTPPGVMLKGEVPEQAGLMHAHLWRVDTWERKWKAYDDGHNPQKEYSAQESRNVVRLRVIKKAPRRDVVIPERFWAGLVKNRMARPYSYGYDAGTFDPVIWLAEKEENALRGRAVGSRIKSLTGKYVAETLSEIHLLKKKIEVLEKVSEWLVANDIEPNNLHNWNTKEQLDKAARDTPNETLQFLERIHGCRRQIERGVETMSDIIDDYKKEAGESE